RFWMLFFIVRSMNSYARSLLVEFFGTTHRFPPEPSVIALPGHRNVPYWKVLMSLAKRPAHQLPENSIGFLPAMNPVPPSSAFVAAGVLAMVALRAQAAKVFAAYVQAASWKSAFPVYRSYASTQDRSALVSASWYRYCWAMYSAPAFANGVTPALANLSSAAV